MKSQKTLYNPKFHCASQRVNYMSCAQVEFNLSESRRTGFKKAVNVTVVKWNSEIRRQVNRRYD